MPNNKRKKLKINKISELSYIIISIIGIIGIIGVLFLLYVLYLFTRDLILTISFVFIFILLLFLSLKINKNFKKTKAITILLILIMSLLIVSISCIPYSYMRGAWFKHSIEYIELADNHRISKEELSDYRVEYKVGFVIDALSKGRSIQGKIKLKNQKVKKEINYCSEFYFENFRLILIVHDNIYHGKYYFYKKGH